MICSGLWSRIKYHAFGLAMTLSFLLAIVAGLGILKVVQASAPELLNDRVAMQIGYLGELYQRALTGIALPLFMFCIIYSMSALEAKHVCRFGLSFLFYAILTKVTAILLVASFDQALRPGLSARGNVTLVVDTSDPKEVVGVATFVDHYLDLVRNALPGNVVEMTVRQCATYLTLPPNATAKTPLDDWDVSSRCLETSEFLAVVVISVVVGAAFRKYNNEPDGAGALMTRLIYCFSEMTLAMTAWVHRVAPVGVFFLVAKDVFNLHADAGGAATRYALTLALCAVVQLAVVYPILYVAVYRASPYRFAGEIVEATLTAAATRSNLAALPVTVKIAEERLRYDPRLTRLVLPLGAIFNNDGDFVYLCVSAFFVADLNGAALSAGNVLAVFGLALVGAAANNGVPRGLVMSVWVYVLGGIGVDVDARAAALLYLGNLMFGNLASYANVAGDCFGLAVVVGFNQMAVDSLGGGGET